MSFALVFRSECGVWADLIGLYTSIPTEVAVVAVILIQLLLEIGQMLCGGWIL
jgi:hypothetical protein